MKVINAIDEYLNRIYLENHAALLRFLTLSTKCPETAADLAQEVYLKLPGLKPVPNSEHEIKAWLFRVASNIAVDHYRTKKRHLEIINDELPQRDISNQVPTPETLFFQEEQLREIQNSLNELPSVCTEVLYLSRIEGLTHQAIAERLGISKSWVEKQLFRALDHLRKSMHDD
ncbi:MAG: RNA polymerase sigma factor [Methylococcaceae bacterium]|nr:RNA polymerase sigma factor [Methylococcaceae bacterium]